MCVFFVRGPGALFKEPKVGWSLVGSLFTCSIHQFNGIPLCGNVEHRCALSYFLFARSAVVLCLLFCGPLAAAINNNPFEYWITHKDPAYNTLMEGVQAFIDSPGAHDVAVKELFSEAMFADLCKLLTEHGIAGVEGTRSLWESDYSKRLIVSGFLKDKDIGDKRLASMPDRITNTINTLDAGIQCRPTVINMYEGELASLDAWWEQWKNFFFEIKVTLQGRSGPKTSSVCQLLEPITHAKYPAISLEEEKISLPLQCLCQAVFDAILVSNYT